MRRTFIEFPAFSRLARAGKLTDSQLEALQNDIMKGGGTTIANTGGLKKIRCAGRAAGKRGSLRVIFADYPKAAVTVLIVAFEKGVKAGLTGAEANELRKLKRVLDEEMGV